MHAKIVVVDGMWTVLGSTNFDNRTYGLNDEINLATLDLGVAARVLNDFEQDLRRCRRITFTEWARRPALERLLGLIASVFSRQQ